MDLQDRTRSLDTEKQAHLADIETLKEQIGKSKGDVEREQRKKERLEKETKEVKSALEKKNEEVKAKVEAIERGQEELKRLEMKLKDAEQQVGRSHKENRISSPKKHRSCSRISRSRSQPMHSYWRKIRSARSN